MLLVGASYKPGVADTREAPALEIIARLRAEGAHVDYHDPLVPSASTVEEVRLSAVATPDPRRGSPLAASVRTPRTTTWRSSPPCTPTTTTAGCESLPGGARLHLPPIRSRAQALHALSRCRSITTHRILKGLAGLYLMLLLVAVMAYKAAFAGLLFSNVFFGVYSVCVASYILSRFLFSLFYRSRPDVGHRAAHRDRDAGLQRGGGDRPARCARCWSSTTRPRSSSWSPSTTAPPTPPCAEMQRVAAESEGRVSVIDFPAEPRQARRDGRRHPRHLGRGDRVRGLRLRRSSPTRSTRLVQPLADPRVGAVCGHANVLNVRDTWITRMQAVRYFVAFRVVKAAESVFGAVTCCSGCFSAYRREAIMPRLEWWENQTFLGVESTFGDDRSLTNCVLRDWRILYEKRAVSHTIVPTTFRAFVKQQTRWKRSWTRESLLVAKFIWRKHPIAAFFTYMSIVLPLLAPVAALHSLVWGPLTHHGVLPLTYLAGIYALALVYSFYFLLFQDALQRPLAVRDPVRLLLPRDHAVADLLRDRHLPHRRLGHPTRHRRPRRRGRGGIGWHGR